MTTYLAACTGRRVFNGTVLDCPRCGCDRGLTFTTDDTSRAVTGVCPNRHRWDEHRIPASAVRAAAIASDRRR